MRSRTRPMSLSVSSCGGASRCSVCTSTCRSAVHDRGALRVVCLTSSAPPGRRGCSAHPADVGFQLARDAAARRVGRSSRRGRCRARPAGAASPTSARAPPPARRRRCRSRRSACAGRRAARHLVAAAQRAARQLAGVAAVVAGAGARSTGGSPTGREARRAYRTGGRRRPRRSPAGRAASGPRTRPSPRSGRRRCRRSAPRSGCRCHDGRRASVAAQLAREPSNSATISSKRAWEWSDQVHLVDRHDEMGDAEQRADERVALGLLQHALARVDAGSPTGRPSRRP